MQEHGQTREFSPGHDAAPGEDWLAAARDRLDGPGRYLVMHDPDGSARALAIASGWTRIGRSVNADFRLDDPSVSRRHALIVSERPDSLRVLDDRSLNGVHVNGEQVEWSRLNDGDQLSIGRFILFVFEI
jgi:pSer/pThr/pTyr-binding forkhead associated (FHA) protein